jgi:hypothetical protein
MTAENRSLWLQRKPSVVAPFYDFRLEKNQFTKV